MAEKALTAVIQEAGACPREGRVLSCPRHGYEFDLDDGRQLFRERPAQLRLFPVVLDGDRVSIHLPERRAGHRLEGSDRWTRMTATMTPWIT